mmetsp:Transcript_5945/g.17151  ORF Transcript_5945/g.17151 Transcript_5945/m.17151 type:complete len:643 (-) Transcript_5945:154-2082(-)
MSGSNNVSLNALLKKTEHYDKDERYMATSDLCEALKRHASAKGNAPSGVGSPGGVAVGGGGGGYGGSSYGHQSSQVIDTSTERRICTAVLKLLDDNSNDVQAIAVKTLGVLLTTVHEEQVIEIADRLCTLVLDAAKSELRDVYTIGLRTLVKTVPLQMGDLVSHRLVTRLVDGIRNNSTSSSSSSSSEGKTKSLVVLLPQLGEFDSSEFCEHLIAASDALTDADIRLRVVGIGDPSASREFCSFTGLDPDALRIDPDGSLHRALGLYSGPGFDIPDFVSDDALKFALNALPGGAPPDDDDGTSASQLRPVGKAWLNYLAMCAGIGAPGTLREILRGYFGDYDAPERFAEDDVVNAGFIAVGPGVGPVKMGPLEYTQWFADESGYQRPVELATVRLKNMVEVLTKWDRYVSNPSTISQRGGTYLFDDETGETLYEYRHRGVLTYSETMPRPLSFLSPYIDEDVARNPLGLPDSGGKTLGTRGRGILKPAGKAMGLLGPLFSAENRLQARASGADDADLAAAKERVESIISSNEIAVFTYGLSPFSSEAIAVLDEANAVYERVEAGLEWFLLDKEGSALRAALLDMTGQSSLPHVFVDGEHVGGLFTGPNDETRGGLAGLKESGELGRIVQGYETASTAAAADE